MKKLAYFLFDILAATSVFFGVLMVISPIALGYTMTGAGALLAVTGAVLMGLGIFSYEKIQSKKAIRIYSWLSRKMG